MANVVKFFTDIDLKTVAMEAPCGTAEISGGLSNWSEIGQFTGTEKIYYRRITAQSGVSLNGTGAVATIFSPENWVTGDNPKIIDGDVRNAFFINCVNMSSGDTPNYRGYVFYINGRQWYETYNHKWMFSTYVMLGTYRADPTNKVTTKAERVSYWYYTGGDYEVHAEVSSPGWDSNSQFNQIAMYSCTVEGKDYFLFVLGVNNGALHPSNETPCMLIPTSYFKYNKPKPSSGIQPKDKKSSAFITGQKTDGTGNGRQNYDTNPYGIKGGVSTDLVALSKPQANNLISAIYGKFWLDVNGTKVETTKSDQQIQGTMNHMAKGSQQTSPWGEAVNAYNMNLGNLGTSLLTALNIGGDIGTAISQGTGTRKSEIIDHILDGILVCHIVPDVNIVGGANTINSIAGVELPSIACSDVNSEIIERTFTIPAIARKTNCYLDFEPFTTCTLHLPFVGEVSFDPSIAYAGGTVKYFIDIYTGGVSVEVWRRNTYQGGANSACIAVKQGSCAVDFPIVGTGRNQKGQEKMIAALASIATGGPSGAITGMAQLAMHGDEMLLPNVITKQSNPGVNCYLAPRDIYMTLTIPKNANPDDFVTMLGYKWNGTGNISQAGYYEVQDARLDNVPAIQAVKDQILARLREGVIVV